MFKRRSVKNRHAGRSSDRRCCCGGCFGVVMLGLALFVIAFVRAGQYRPVIPPPPPLPHPNALDDYIAAGLLYDANGGESTLNVQGVVASLTTKASVVQANGAALARLRAGLAKECGIPFEPSVYTPFPYISTCRKLGRLLATQAEVCAARGDYIQAAQSSIDAIQLGISIKHGGTLIHGLAGNSIESMGNSMLLTVNERLDAAQCVRVGARLQDLVRKRVTVREAILNEKRWMLSELLRLKDDDTAALIFPGGQDGDVDMGRGRALAGKVAWHFARDRTLRTLEQHFDSIADDAGKPVSQRTNAPMPGGVAGMFAPDGGQLIDTLGRTDLRTRLLTIAIAIRGYRLTHGTLPASLSELGLDREVTLDVDAGRPITYRRNAGDYLLYGVGPDGKDDGGSPANEQTSPLVGDIGVRDFAFQPPPSKQSARRYRLVPHMIAPKMPPGYPPLKD